MKKIYAIILLTSMVLVSCWQNTWQLDETSNNDVKWNEIQWSDEGFIEPGSQWVFLSDPSTTLEDGVSDENASTSHENPINL